MNEVSPEQPAPVSPDAEAIITDVLGYGFPAGIGDDLLASPHRLSSADIAFRIRSMRKWSPERIRAGLNEILTELELYRQGYDAGYEAGPER
ncbi:MAG: hypothetical protein QOF10_4705, partial [Kribbellaceae bacterium]|nr:hypothetical protein [Kribbellaceae bacterium]